MKWRSFGFFAVFFSVLVSVFLFHNTSALSDLNFTISSNTDFPYLCYSSTPCSDYSYLVIESDSSVPLNATINFSSHKIPSGSFFTISIPLRSKYTILNITNFNFVSSNFLDFQVTSYSNFTSGIITLTLTDQTPSFSQISGSLSITDNGTYDVSSYAEAVVDVPPLVIEGDYHDDLVNIYHGIMVCAGVLLVLYFFYCIYRLITKSTGGQ